MAVRVYSDCRKNRRTGGADPYQGAELGIILSNRKLSITFDADVTTRNDPVYRQRVDNRRAD